MNLKKIISKITDTSKKVVSKADYFSSYLCLLDNISAANSIGIIGHDKIDGDSLGSVLAMQQWIRNKFPNKKVKSYTNRRYSSVFDFLSPDILFGDNLKIDEDTDLLIIMDTADLSRLGELYENNKQRIDETYKVNIDHHISNTKFGDINIVDASSPATAQIVYEILKFFDIHPIAQINTLKKGIDKKVSLYLLMGILTDTQNFTTPLANDKTLQIASNLIKGGADKEMLVNNIFLNKRLEELKLQGLVVDRIKKVTKGPLKYYYSYYTQKDLEKLGLDPKDPGVGRSLVSVLVQISDADFVCLWKIFEDETTVSFRSKKYDVNRLAKHFNGGGHKNASGGKLSKKIDYNEIEKIISDALDKIQ